MFLSIPSILFFIPEGVRVWGGKANKQTHTQTQLNTYTFEPVRARPAIPRAPVHARGALETLAGAPLHIQTPSGCHQLLFRRTDNRRHQGQCEHKGDNPSHKKPGGQPEGEQPKRATKGRQVSPGGHPRSHKRPTGFTRGTTQGPHKADRFQDKKNPSAGNET